MYEYRKFRSDGMYMIQFNSEEEVNCLVDVYIDNRHEYHGKLKSASTSGMSKQVWETNVSRNVC